MEVTLEVTPRTETGKGPARRARANGFVPAVFYGTAVDPVSLYVDAKAMSQALHTEAGGNVLINFNLDGEKYLTVPREIQRHPIRGDLLHVDFIRVARDVKITAHVPLHVVGEAAGVKSGGQLDQYVHELEVEALPTDVPTSVEVDVSALEMGDSMRTGDIALPAGVTLVGAEDELALSVHEPTVMQLEEEVEEAEEAEAAEAEAEGETAQEAEAESGEAEESSED